ncbi:MAG: Flp pilus assembly protein CpaB [Betaproteobacteria bacterium]|nr:Flp pilus assembly protein CpaB [Betaproteobacteria bacterium]
MRIIRILLSRINRMWLLLGAAILLGLAATWVTLQYLKVREQRIEAEVKKRASGGNTVDVIAVARNLPKGTVIGADNLVKREILEDLVYDGETVPLSDFDKVDGLKLARAVEGGRPLRRSDLDIRAKDFAEALPQGTRAITIDVDEINSVSQMVRPGNLVDLMLIVPDPSDTNGGQQIVSLLQKVKVLATGQIIARSADAKGTPAPGPGGPGGSTPQRYSNFTFEVTPEEAARIALAQQLGKIRAVLRNDEDQRMDPLAKVNSQSLLRGYTPGVPGKKGQTQAEALPPTVEFIIGGKGGSGVGTTVNVNMTNPLGGTAPGAAAPAAGVPAPVGTGQVNIPGLGNVPFTVPPAAGMSGSGSYGAEQRRP